MPGDQFVGWIAYPPKGFSMPPGYGMEGLLGESPEGRNMTRYYWWRKSDNETGPMEKDKRKVCRQAWLDHRKNT